MTQYDYAIIGAGLAGSRAFERLSTLGSCILLEKRSEPSIYHLVRSCPAHNYKWMEGIPLDNMVIFPRNHQSVTYASDKLEAIVSGTEFGTPLGKIIDEYQFIHWAVSEGKKHGGQIFWDQKVISIHVNDNGMTIDSISLNGTSMEFESQIVVIATGNNEIKLQQALGFSTPQELFTHAWLSILGDTTQINTVPGSDYVYRLHPKMSTVGPFWLIRGRDCITFGLISSESHEVIGDKLLRIIRNYKPIQQYISALTTSVDKISVNDIQFLRIAKQEFSPRFKKRCVLIGDTAGLLTPMYFEGILGCFASSQIVYDLLKQIQIQGGSFNTDFMSNYDWMLRSTIGRWMDSGKAAESLFLKSGPHQALIWDTYLDLINKNRQVRKNVHTAWIYHDLEHYPLENDEFCGTQLFFNLPMTHKVLLTPLFLKQKFNIK